MKQNLTLTVTSLLSILLLSFHFSDDIVRGFEPGGPKNVIGSVILAVWLYGTLVLSGRLPGYIIMILGAILGVGIPVLHMMGKGLVGGDIAGSTGVHFWVWTLLALGTSSLITLVLAAEGLWGLARGKHAA